MLIRRRGPGGWQAGRQLGAAVPSFYAGGGQGIGFPRGKGLATSVSGPVFVGRLPGTLAFPDVAAGPLPSCHKAQSQERRRQKATPPAPPPEPTALAWPAHPACPRSATRRRGCAGRGEAGAGLGTRWRAAAALLNRGGLWGRLGGGRALADSANYWEYTGGAGGGESAAIIPPDHFKSLSRVAAASQPRRFSPATFLHCPFASEGKALFLSLDLISSFAKTVDSRTFHPEKRAFSDFHFTTSRS